ncbi:NAD-dependent succinate-semialdehyde dehydrogenase [Pseudooceanicola onchidii]|uniref:NAD-dependent succinate-semialdehyde dehydrogenase n=1 Tax=Pseudooceanicola onchidii TaxID=2562279 RepID=UPI0010AA566B|nr:NAD-dependent succinate-semialdehyde dehydrogenase [Pseudooceanicola onchidii]
MNTRTTPPILSINPATGETLAEFSSDSASVIEAKLAATAAAQSDWARLTIEERCGLLDRMAKALRSGAADYACLITLEMGKPIAEAEAEIEKCAWCCEHYRDQAAAYLKGEVIASGASHSEVVFDPLGSVLAVMPWNYPFWQFFRFAAPALAAGNATLLKHASNVPQCALAIADVMAAAGAPEGLTATLMIGSGAVRGVLADPRVAAVTLTGSTEVGAQVAAQAGGLLKKQVLELGGSDPFIVLEDADIDAAVAVAVKSRFQNTGQSCIAAKRFIVVDAIADRFADAFTAGAAALKVGDPFDRSNTQGSMARANLRDELHDQVTRALTDGATLRTGGAPLDGPGAFYQPTVLDHVTPDNPVFREETFGPVAAIVRVPDADTAVAQANATEFGLGAGLWTADLDRARTLARRIEAGAVFVNGLVASDPRLPFGGIKQSGYGRELGAWGIREFTNTKTLWVGPASS